MKTKLIIFLYSLANWGGAEHIILKVCRYLAQTKMYNITLIGLFNEQPALEKEFEALGIKIIYLDNKIINAKTKAPKLSLIPKIFRLYKILKKEKPALLFNVLFPCIILGGLVGKIAGIKNIIGNLHGPAVFKSAFAVKLDHIVSRFYKGYIAVADHIKQQFSTRENIPEEKITIIYNGIEEKYIPPTFDRNFFRRQWRIAENDIVIGTIGRTYKEKNQIYLIDIAEKLQALIPSLKLLIVGDGPTFNDIKEHIRKKQLEAVCILAGWQTKTAEFMKCMDLFVLPSHYEGMPCSIIEAWQLKIPVAGTNVRGIKDLITDNKTGMILHPHDAQAAADSINELLKDKEKLQKIITNGYKEWQQNFTVEKMCQAHHSYFQNLVI